MQTNLTQGESEKLPVLIHIVNDTERIGDHSENIIELVERKIENKLNLSIEEIKQLHLMWNELHSMMVETEKALKQKDIAIAAKAIAREDRINALQVELKQTHVNRLSEKTCTLKSGVVFLDFVDNLEKIGDHLCNIVQGVLGGMCWKTTDKLKK